MIQNKNHRHSVARRILIVEDEKQLSRAIEVELKKSGFEVKLAYTGEDALEIMSKEKFDLILLDLILPKKDGFMVMKELNEAGDKTPVVVCSNLCTDDDKEKAKELGVKDFFVKADMSINEFGNKVKNILNL